MKPIQDSCLSLNIVGVVVYLMTMNTAVCLLTLVSTAVIHGLAVCPDRRTKQPSLRSFKIDIQPLAPRTEAHI